MDIRLNINEGNKAFSRNSTISGLVELSTERPVDIEDVELRLTPPPGHTATDAIVEKLNHGMRLEGARVFPLSIDLHDRYVGDLSGAWTVEVIASTVNGRTYGTSYSVLLEEDIEGEHPGGIAAPILLLVAGVLSIGFAIGGFPQIDLPEWVYWGAFGIGYVAVIAAAHKLNSRCLPEDARLSGRLLIFSLILGAIGGLYLVTIQPDLTPLRLDFRPQRIQPVLSIIDPLFARQQVIGLLLATTFIAIVGSIFSRRRVSIVDQIAIAITVAGITGLLIGVTCIADAFLHYKTDFPSPTFMVLGILSLAIAFAEFRRPSWTEAPAVAILTAAIPFTIGILGLSAASGDGVEIVAAALLIAWSVLIAYFGGRHILASRLSGQVKIVVAPNPVRVGTTLAVQVRARPRAGVRVDGATAEILCEQEVERWDNKTIISTVHDERRHITTDDSVARGANAILDTHFRIPLIGPLTRNNSDKSGEGSWTLIVTVHFHGAPDHREAFSIDVIA